jgi:hypothetical protein
VVVGGGWAGFGAALALAKAGAQVTLLDASANPGGLSSAFKTAGGQLVEPGIKGFWYQVGVGAESVCISVRQQQCLQDSRRATGGAWDQGLLVSGGRGLDQPLSVCGSSQQCSSSAFKTAGGQLVKPGIKGFWYQVGWLQNQSLSVCGSSQQCSSGAFKTAGGQMAEPDHRVHGHVRQQQAVGQSSAKIKPCPGVCLQYANIEMLVYVCSTPTLRCWCMSAVRQH